MFEAIILGAMRKLESYLVETPSISAIIEKIVKEVINEHRMMLDFLRDEESEKRSRLNYLLADYAEMAQVSADLTEKPKVLVNFIFHGEMVKVLDWLRKTEKRIKEYGVGDEMSRLSGDEGVVVGLGNDVQQLIGRVILNDVPGLTLCIKGMIGVGKTTLARQVYNHVAIVRKFKRRAWVNLSSNTSMKEVLVELILQLEVGSEGLERDSLLAEEMDIRSLQHMLRQKLQGMLYFIVVDNLRPEMCLQYILDGLPDEGYRSRLLITSRYKIITADIYYTHEMKALDSEDSWQLFLKTIDKFTSVENKFTKELERKGKEMLRNCGGLPAAIIDVGRQKAKQRLSGIEWEELFDSIDLSESLKLLEPMYLGLDEELKSCFLHMSLFKENAIMREEKLEQIWDASGFNIQNWIKHNSFCQSPLQWNAYNLFSQSIIEVVYPYQRFPKVKRCRMNPLLHKLSIKKAEEEMGFEILRSNGNNRHSRSPHHRVIRCSRDKFNHSTYQVNKHLISLILHGGGRYLDDTNLSYWKSLELLKILDMEDFGVKALPEAVGSLIELRYLGLRNNYIQEIPNTLQGLKRLEVLDIALNFMVEVIDVIKELGSLRHLYMSDVICREPLKVDALQNLETLAYMSIYNWTFEISSSVNMTRLRKLGIEEVDENLDVGGLFPSLAKLKRLDHLILRGFRFRSMPCLDEMESLFGVQDRRCTIKLDGLLYRLPRTINIARYISYLILINTCLDEDPMPVLGQLGWLYRLKLRNAYIGRKIVIRHHQFTNLQILSINELWNLRNIQVGEGAMSNLNQLEINNCPHLKTLPEEIGSMVYLKKFKMVTTKHIATKIRNSCLISKIMEVDISP